MQFTKCIFSIITALLLLFGTSQTCQAQLGLGAAAMQKVQLAKQLAVLKSIKSSVGKSKTTLNKSLNASKEQLSLQKKWLNSYEQINTRVKNYRRVKTIITRQLLIVSMQKDAMKRFMQDKNFKAQEVKAMGESYKILIQESLSILAELRLILRPRAIKMTDAERIEAINALDERMKFQYGLTRYYTGSMMQISRMRSDTEQEINTVNKLYGLDKT